MQEGMYRRRLTLEPSARQTVKKIDSLKIYPIELCKGLRWLVGWVNLDHLLLPTTLCEPLCSENSIFLMW